MAFHAGQSMVFSKPAEARMQTVGVAQIDARLAETCEGQAWPNYSRDCLKETRPDAALINVILTRR